MPRVAIHLARDEMAFEPHRDAFKTIISHESRVMIDTKNWTETKRAETFSWRKHMEYFWVENRFGNLQY